MPTQTHFQSDTHLPPAAHRPVNLERRRADNDPENRRQGGGGRELPGKSSHSTILVDATRAFSLLKRPDTSDVEHYKELFYQFIDRIEKTDRRLISAMLARSPYSPRPVALYLAQDALEVAAPFLLFSPVLNDLDLRAIASKRGKIYADVIKKRQLPMEPFTAQKLDEAPLSKPSDRATMPFSKPDADQGENLSAGTKDDIIALAGVGGRLGKKPPVTAAAALASTNQGQEAIKDFKLPKKEMRSLLSAARKQDRHAFARLVEELSGLEIAATEKLLATPSGDETLYLIKALGVPSPHDIQMAMMAVPRFGRSIENYRHAKKTLKELDAGICRMIFNEIGAHFDLTRNRQNRLEERLQEHSANQPVGLHEVMQSRRRNVLETHGVASNGRRPDLKPADPAGMVPMTRWPGSETGLREAV